MVADQRRKSINLIVLIQDDPMVADQRRKSINLIVLIQPMRAVGQSKLSNRWRLLCVSSQIAKYSV